MRKGSKDSELLNRGPGLPTTFVAKLLDMLSGESPKMCVVSISTLCTEFSG